MNISIIDILINLRKNINWNWAIKNIALFPITPSPHQTITPTPQLSLPNPHLITPHNLPPQHLSLQTPFHLTHHHTTRSILSLPLFPSNHHCTTLTFSRWCTLVTSLEMRLWRAGVLRHSEVVLLSLFISLLLLLLFSLLSLLLKCLEFFLFSFFLIGSLSPFLFSLLLSLLLFPSPLSSFWAL